jgi:hypothetical protein
VRGATEHEAYVGGLRIRNRVRANQERNVNEPTVTQAHRAFSLSCAVRINIRRNAAPIWELLTDAEGFPRWNSTVTGIDGRIREGMRIRLHVPGTNRTFTPRISGVVPNERMTWTGGFAPIFKGVRTFVLKQRLDGTTDFEMEERFSGLLLPLARGSMPDFGPVFASFARDLMRAAEE